MLYLIKELWYGDISLAKTFWLFGVLVGILFNFAFKFIEFGSAFFIFLLFVALNYTYLVFIFVAIWRSANKYKGPKAWAILAKIIVIIGIARLIQTVLFLLVFYL